MKTLIRIFSIFVLMALAFGAAAAVPAYAASNPTVTITSIASDPTNLSPIPVTLTFSEPVSGLTLDDLVVGNGTASNLASSGAGVSSFYTQVSAGYYYTCGLVSDGTLKCWGNNNKGKAGAPSLSNGLKYTQVSTGQDHTCAVISDGSIQCWGSNSYNQTTVPTLSGGLEYTQTSTGGFHSCGLVSNGSVKCWSTYGVGQTYVPTLIGGLDYTQISSGMYHSCALVSDGTIKCWSWNDFGQTSVPTLTSGKTYTQVSAGGWHSCGLVSDGTLKCWGRNENGETAVPTLGSGLTYTQVGAGSNHTCGLISDGSIRCWGALSFLATPSSGLVYTQLSVGYFHTCGLASDDSLTCWGPNLYGESAVPSLPLHYSTYTVDITPTAPGTVTVDLSADATQNVTGSGNAAATQFSIVYTPTYTVTYNANGADSGTAPADQTKTYGVDLTLASNSGLLDKTGYALTGWNTQSDGLGTHYALGDTYSTNEPATLYAEWTLIEQFEWLKNTSFEQVGLRSLPTLWTPSYVTRQVDKLDPNHHHTGKYAMKFTGNRASKGLLQTIATGGKTGDKFRISAWSKAARVPTLGGQYAVRVIFMDGSLPVGQFALNFKAGTHNWQQVTQDLQAPADYTAVRYLLIYQKSSGSVWFDDVSLLRILP